MERYTVGGRLSREDLLTAAESVWLRTIYLNDEDNHR